MVPEQISNHTLLQKAEIRVPGLLYQPHSLLGGKANLRPRGYDHYDMLTLQGTYTARLFTVPNTPDLWLHLAHVDIDVAWDQIELYGWCCLRTHKRYHHLPFSPLERTLQNPPGPLAASPKLFVREGEGMIVRLPPQYEGGWCDVDRMTFASICQAVSFRFQPR